jgi:hypothetical protein
MQAHLERLLADGGRGAGQPRVRLRHHRHVRHRQLQRAAALLLRDQACAARARRVRPCAPCSVTNPSGVGPSVLRPRPLLGSNPPADNKLCHKLI